MTASAFYPLLSLTLLGLLRAIGGSTDHDSDSDHVTANTSANDTILPRRKLPTWEPYVYGTLCVIVVSLLSLAGIILLPLIKRKRTYDGVMLTFMSMAVGTMTSDAILHLIPETLGLDSDDDDDSKANDKEHDHAIKPYLGKMVALLGTLYGLFILELILQIGAKLVKKPLIAQSNGSIEDGGSNLSKMSSFSEKNHDHNSTAMTTIATTTTTARSKWASNIGHHGHGHSHSHGGSHGHHVDASEGRTIFGLKSVAFVVVLSDAMHNFTDGLAIGAAFAQSSAAGLGVTIAVVCHEIPHEMGNFAILLNTGMSFKKALLLNFLSAVTAVAGLYPGIAAGQQETVARWIFAGVAAGFLYIALGHMLRELQSYGSLPWYLSFVLQNMGMLAGFMVMFLLAIYEDDLNGIA